MQVEQQIEELPSDKCAQNVIGVSQQVFPGDLVHILHSETKFWKYFKLFSGLLRHSESLIANSTVVQYVLTYVLDIAVPLNILNVC